MVLLSGGGYMPQVDVVRIKFPFFWTHYTNEADAMRAELGFEAGVQRPLYNCQVTCARTVEGAVDLIDRVVEIHERWSEGRNLTSELVGEHRTQVLWEGEARVKHVFPRSGIKWEQTGPRRSELVGNVVKYVRPLRVHAPSWMGGIRDVEERFQVELEHASYSPAEVRSVPAQWQQLRHSDVLNVWEG